MSEPLRIAVIEESAAIGGAEINLLNLCRLLDRDRFRFMVIVPATGPLTERLAELNVEYRIVPRRRLFPASFYWRGRKIFNPAAVLCNLFFLVPQVLQLRSLLRQLQIDVVHTNSMMAHLYGGLAARLSGIPALWHMQDIVDRKLFGVVRWLLNAVGGRLPTRIVAISRAVAQMFSGRALSRLTIVYNGSDSDRFTPGPANETLRRELGLDQECLVVGIIGRLVRWKGHPEFLRAASLVAQQLPQARFLVIGDTTFGPGSYGAELHDLARELGLAERVSFAGARDDVPELMRLLDVLVHASIAPEPFGLVVTEAMAAGLPVVASQLGGPAEIIDHERNGILVDPRDYAACAGAILRLCNDEDLRCRLGVAARQTVVERFSVKDFVENMSAVYVDVATVESFRDNCRDC